MAASTEPNETEQSSSKHASAGQMLAAIVLGVLVIAIGYVVLVPAKLPEDLAALQAAADAAAAATTGAQAMEPRSLDHSDFTNYWDNQFVLWWDDFSKAWKDNTLDTGTNSNIRAVDYVGSDTCRDCHPQNHDLWSKHGHHRMTQFANANTVVGDFSGSKTIEHDGGSARFYKEGDKFIMETKRGDKTWKFHITRTIGWRHMQDYAGFLISGPDETGLGRDKYEHVLPFAFDVAEQEWMPPVHVHPDDDIPDSFEPHLIVQYSLGCSDCHNAYPVGDRMIRRAGLERWSAYVPRPTSLHLSAYLSDAHPEVMTPGKAYTEYPNEEVVKIGRQVRDLQLEETVHLQGITCEACHYGGREHVANSTKTNSTVLPAFFPVSPHIRTAAKDMTVLHAKDAQNMNFICARCHSGSRQQFANGLQAWNSTEYTEAMNGHCYDPLKAQSKGMASMACAQCHNPHETVGLKWSRTPAQDDASCITCHQKFKSAEQKLAHTHHASGDGSHCMDCHMPHTNEGLGRMVRTHRIDNPIDHKLIEANQVNACNLCHLDKSINWTIQNLKDWYDPNFSPNGAEMAVNYKDRNAPVVNEWISSSHPPTRIATAGAIARRNATYALEPLLDQLTVEDYGYNQRIMQKAVDELLGVKMRSMGFKYHLPVAERQAIMKELKPKLLKLSAGFPNPGKSVVKN